MSVRRLLVVLISLSFLSASCKKEEAPAPTPAPPPASVKGQNAEPNKGPQAPGDQASKSEEPKAAPAQDPKSDPKAEEPKAQEPKAEEPKDVAKNSADVAAEPKDSAAQPVKAPAEPDKAEAQPVKVEPPKQNLDVVPPIPVKLPDGTAQPAGTPAPLGATPPAANPGLPPAGSQPALGTVPTAAAPAAVATVASVGTAAGAVATGATWTPPPFQNVEETRTDVRAREAMVKMLQTGYRHAITDERVLKAMGTVPRHEYLLPENRAEGYRQMWFRIGHGQTITDPGMVAWMTQLLAIKPTDKVLEIGTGSGYQGSILSQLTPHAFTIEIVEPLAQRTHKLLAKFGLDKIMKTRIGDGYYGWEEEAPFDKIIVTCAADHIPILLLQQLKPGGLMVIPVGPRYQPGKLHFIAKDAQGKVHKKVLGKVDFVPMTRLKDWGKTDERDAKRRELEKQSKEMKYEETTP